MSYCFNAFATLKQLYREGNIGYGAVPFSLFFSFSFLSILASSEDDVRYNELAVHYNDWDREKYFLLKKKEFPFAHYFAKLFRLFMLHR